MHRLHQRLSTIDAYQHQSNVTSEQRASQHNTDVQYSIAQVYAAQQRLQLNLDIIEASNIARFAESTAGTTTSAAVESEANSSGPIRFSGSTSARNIRSSISITASSPGFRCMIGCSCSCHDRKAIKLRLLDRFFGSLFVGYVGLPYITPKCDDRLCAQRTSPLILATYVFPSWLLAKAILATLKYTYRVGPEFNVRVAPIVPHDSAILHLCKNGDPEGVKSLLRQGLASPYDASSLDGNTPLTVEFITFCLWSQY